MAALLWLDTIFSSGHIPIKASLAVKIFFNNYEYLMTERPLFFDSKRVNDFNQLFEETKLCKFTNHLYFMSPNSFPKIF